MPDIEKKIPFTHTTAIKVTKPVSVIGTILKGVWRSIPRRQGCTYGDEINELIVEMGNVKPDSEKVALYREVCNYGPVCDELPLTYLETLFMDPLGRLFTSPRFPLSPIGIIHITQSIKQNALLPVDAIYDLTCRTIELKETARGLFLDIRLEARIDNQCVWEGTAGFLSRNSDIIKGIKRKKRAVEPVTPEKPKCIFPVKGNTGRRYAKASGDYNPHHLYGITAKVLGYKRPIAHGMWSLARSLAEIEKEILLQFPCSVDVAFKLPVYMPATVALYYYNLSDGNLLFEMKDADKGLPHLKGKVKIGSVENDE